MSCLYDLICILFQFSLVLLSGRQRGMSFPTGRPWILGPHRNEFLGGLSGSVDIRDVSQFGPRRPVYFPAFLN